MSEEKVVSAVSAANVKAHVEHITTEIPSRLAGSANGKRMAEYSAAALTRDGVSATVFEIACRRKAKTQSTLEALPPLGEPWGKPGRVFLKGLLERRNKALPQGATVSPRWI